LTSGVVSQIYVREGQSVSAGTTLAVLTNDYNSGNAGIQKRIAQNNAALTEKTSPLQKDVITLEADNARKDEDLNKREENIALKNLKVENAQRKTALANSYLELALANTADASLHPKALFSGTVEKIFVRPGQYVTPGTPLFVLSSPHNNAEVQVTVSYETLQTLNVLSDAYGNIDGHDVSFKPTFIPTEGDAYGLYTLIYTAPEDTLLVDNSIINLALPVSGTYSDHILLPLDAVFQDSRRAWVFVENNGKAELKEIHLGAVHGKFVEASGIDPQTSVLLNRNLIEGETVQLP
jgi:pyruvate/2-oxoglutarate dehydrogenase complex dihydrolipoamide acyltransferase (E2) component